jgi:hypothetical protein
MTGTCLRNRQTRLHSERPDRQELLKTNINPPLSLSGSNQCTVLRRGDDGPGQTRHQLVRVRLRLRGHEVEAGLGQIRIRSSESTKCPTRTAQSGAVQSVREKAVRSPPQPGHASLAKATERARRRVVPGTTDPLHWMRSAGQDGRYPHGVSDH